MYNQPLFKRNWIPLVGGNMEKKNQYNRFYNCHFYPAITDQWDSICWGQWDLALSELNRKYSSDIVRKFTVVTPFCNELEGMLNSSLLHKNCLWVNLVSLDLWPSSGLDRKQHGHSNCCQGFYTIVLEINPQESLVQIGKNQIILTKYTSVRIVHSHLSFKEMSSRVNEWCMTSNEAQKHGKGF